MSRLFVEFIERYHLTRATLDECHGCRFSDWIEKPSSSYTLCTYHEGWVDACQEFGL